MPALLVQAVLVALGLALAVLAFALLAVEPRGHRRHRTHRGPPPADDRSCDICGQPLPSPYTRLCPRCGHHTSYGRLVRTPRRLAWELPLLAGLLLVLGWILWNWVLDLWSSETISREDAKRIYQDLKNDRDTYLRWFRETGIYWLAALLVVAVLLYSALRPRRDR